LSAALSFANPAYHRRIALTRDLHDDRIDDLTTLGRQALSREFTFEAREQRVGQFDFLDPLFESPNRFGIGRPVLNMKAETPLETRPVTDLIEYGERLSSTYDVLAASDGTDCTST
jgi:hypothetical protein